MTKDYSTIKVNIVTLENTIEAPILFTMDEATSWLVDSGVS